VKGRSGTEPGGLLEHRIAIRTHRPSGTRRARGSSRPISWPTTEATPGGSSARPSRSPASPRAGPSCGPCAEGGPAVGPRGPGRGPTVAAGEPVRGPPAGGLPPLGHRRGARGAHRAPRLPPPLRELLPAPDEAPGGTREGAKVRRRCDEAGPHPLPAAAGIAAPVGGGEDRADPDVPMLEPPRAQAGDREVPRPAHPHLAAQGSTEGGGTTARPPLADITAEATNRLVAHKLT
jgi:hypothetical protein